MSCAVLTEERWKRFLENKLAKDELRECIDHFAAGGCEGCLEFLEQLDMSLEDVLRDELHEGNQPHNPAAKVPQEQSRVVPLHNKPVSGVAHKRHIPVWVGGMAAAILVLITVPILYQQDDQIPQQNDIRVQSLKGIANKNSVIDVKFAIGHHDKSRGLVVTEGLAGQQYNDTGLLFLHYDLDLDGYVYIFGIKPDNTQPELLFPESSAQIQLRHAGQYDVPDNDHISGISLKGIKGRYAIVSLYSRQPLVIDERLISALNAHVHPGNGLVDETLGKSIGKDVSVDLVYFDVTPATG